MKSYNAVSLFFSLIIATSFYSVLLYSAPQIMLLTANAKVGLVETTYNVDIIDLPTPQILDNQSNPPDSPKNLSVPDFNELFPSLKEDVPTTLPESEWEPETFDELNNQNVNADPNRAHELDPDQQLFKGIDAQILEISESVARDHIEIARRMVRPSPTRPNTEQDLNALFRSQGNKQPLTMKASPQRDSALEPRSETPVIDQEILNEIEIIKEELFENELLDFDSIEPSSFVPERNEIALRTEILQQQISKEIKHDAIDHMVKLDIKTFVQPNTNQGYYELSIFPNEEMNIQTLPRDITFVIDASNSILQRKLDSTLVGVKNSFQHLKPADRFNIVVFRDRGSFLSPDYLPVTSESLEQARRFLTNLKSQGSTDVYNALTPVFQVPTRPGYPAIIIFVSDGRPSSGSLTGRDLINAVSDSNTSRQSIFTFGTGKTVNNYLLDLLAYRNKSESNISTRIEEVETLIPKRLQQLDQPYLVNIKGQFNSLNESTIFPKEIPDFYNKKEVVLYGRFNPEIDNDLTLQLTGDSGNQTKTMLLKTNINSGLKGTSQISQKWAKAKVYHLINQVSKYGQTPELMGEIQSLSKQYNLTNAYVAE